MVELLSIKDVSTLLKVKVKTLYQWVGLNQIPHLRLNGSIRFDPDDVLAWVKSCKKEPAEEYNICTQARGPRKGGM